MESNDKTLLVYRIINGYYRLRFGKKDLIIRSPSKELIYESEMVYNECYKKSLMMGIFDDEDVYEFLITQGKWTEEDEKLLTDTLPENLKKFKKGLYQSFFRNSGLDTRTIEKSIEVTREEIFRLQSIRYSLGEITCKGVAFIAQQLFLIENTTHDGNQLYCFDDVSEKEIYNKKAANIITESQYRELARSNPWFTIWTTHKQGGKLFDGFMTEEQQSLVDWSIRFDNIYQNPECPSDAVLDNHDALDGWFLIRAEKHEKQSLQNEIEKSLNPKVRGAGEIYLPAKESRAIDEIQGFSASEINSLNSEQAEAIKQSKMRQVSSKGHVREQDFSESQRQLRMQAVNEARQRMGKR